MGKQKSNEVDIHKTVLDIYKKLNDAKDFDSALTIATEELNKALEVDRIQIVLHRSEQN
jgi:hypothetical protein